MKQKIIILLLLIGSTSCSSQTKDYPKDILGCWKVIDTQYDIKSNYPHIDAIADSIYAIKSKERLERGGWSKFLEGNVQQSFGKDDKQLGFDNYYRVDGETLFAQSSVRDDDKQISKMIIRNDTLFLEASIPEAFDDFLLDLRFDIKQEAPDDIKLEKWIRYTTFIRVPDCD
ncbi:hypothetical protein M2451_003830 [Dysgonomonas sp. PFB1-18]|uniref:hypothetical protein n=1 Tax=unclassified Dysgonomonas TaxID=2630389 RepID=UPI0024771398|nr:MULTISPECIES: hypothetical protein [unclassified Dysgonomonas]MDH6309488.1 hypothetical protein [Dysgonomonas sp. PF1-14]MDH6340898.1 hypothetical protein [Dysgonomonas sp. PF1-16]MDH6382489.1 hypothetical protein [Dysgonomonas sp. PFB1-18]MDH6399867.1 hypothetical protein [Dysgonomonas sp. PF1-23]